MRGARDERCIAHRIAPKRFERFNLALKIPQALANALGCSGASRRVEIDDCVARIDVFRPHECRSSRRLRTRTAEGCDGIVLTGQLRERRRLCVGCDDRLPPRNEHTEQCDEKVDRLVARNQPACMRLRIDPSRAAVYCSTEFGALDVARAIVADGSLWRKPLA